MPSKPSYRIEILAPEVTQRRLRLALNREQLAKAAGISESRLHKIEAGLAEGVSPETVQGLCKALGCSPEDISTVAETPEKATA